jgi:hypothetical protein
MTISSTTRIAGPFLSGTALPVTFKVFTAADLKVVRLNTSTGVETSLVLGSDYTVALNGNQNTNPGGTVNLTVAASATSTVTITSDIANLQPTDLTNQGGFYPEVITDALDRATIQIQQMSEDVGRSLKGPISDGNLNMELPTAAQRANSFLAFDANGVPTAVVSGSTGAPTTITRQVFSGTGSQTVFTLASDPGALGNSAQVYIGGVYQQRSTYTIGGTTLTFSSAPVAGTDNIEFVNFLTSNIGATSADLVTYTPSGTSAVARSAASKFGDTVSVKDFGAVGDGVADDTAAIQAAINYANANGKRYVVAPCATYKISSTITVGKGTLVRDVLVIDFEGSRVNYTGAGNAFYSFRERGFNICNINLYATTGDRVAGTIGIKADSLQPNNSDSYSVENFYIYNFDVGIELGSVGVGQNAVNLVRVINGMIEHVGDAIRTRSSNIDLALFESIQISDCTRNGFDFERMGIGSIRSSFGYGITGAFIKVDSIIESFEFINVQEELSGNFFQSVGWSQLFNSLVFRGCEINSPCDLSGTGNSQRLIKFDSCNVNANISVNGDSTVVFDNCFIRTGATVSAAVAGSLVRMRGCTILGTVTSVGDYSAVDIEAPATSSTEEPISLGSVTGTIQPDFRRYSIFQATLTGNTTIQNRYYYLVHNRAVFVLTQDATGGRTITFSNAAATTWTYDTTGLTTVANTTSVWEFVRIGTVYYLKSLRILP